MDERNNEMEIVDVNESYDGYEIEECSEETGIDWVKLAKGAAAVCGAIALVAITNRKRIATAIRNGKEKKMRKYANELGFDIVDPDEYYTDDYEDCDVNDDCESDKE